MAISYLTLTDYAKLNNITIEEAKNRLDTEKYKKYLKSKGDTFLISFDIFNLENDKEEDRLDKHLIKTEENKEEEKEKQDNDNNELDSLRREIEELKQTIAEKDKQINDFALKFAELAKQAQIIAGQAQVLHLAEKAEPEEKPTIEIGQTNDKKEAPAITKNNNIETTKRTAPTKNKKKGLLRRLLKGR